ncbi:unnamed protein product, partial [Allacma fusca]
MIPGEC